MLLADASGWQSAANYPVRTTHFVSQSDSKSPVGPQNSDREVLGVIRLLECQGLIDAVETIYVRKSASSSVCTRMNRTLGQVHRAGKLDFAGKMLASTAAKFLSAAHSNGLRL